MSCRGREGCTEIMYEGLFNRGVMTMRILMIPLVLLISSCVTYHPAPMAPAAIETGIALPGMAQENIYEKSKEWIERHLYSKGHVIDVADKKSGLIVANGFIAYPAEGKMEEIDRIQYTISFTMQAHVGDHGMEIVFDNLMVDIPRYYSLRPKLYQTPEYYGGYSVPVVEKGDYEAARRGLLDIARRLEEYLKRNAGE